MAIKALAMVRTSTRRSTAITRSSATSSWSTASDLGVVSADDS
jgi:hypothetical protein